MTPPNTPEHTRLDALQKLRSGIQDLIEIADSIEEYAISATLCQALVVANDAIAGAR